MLTVTKAAVASVWLAAAQVGEPSALALEALMEMTAEPEAVRFRQVQYGFGSPVTVSVCGQMNAKNQFGGYIGYRRFVVVLSPTEGAAWKIERASIDGQDTALFPVLWRLHCREPTPPNSPPRSGQPLPP